MAYTSVYAVVIGLDFWKISFEVASKDVDALSFSTEEISESIPVEFSHKPSTICEVKNGR